MNVNFADDDRLEIEMTEEERDAILSYGVQRIIEGALKQHYEDLNEICQPAPKVVIIIEGGIIQNISADKNMNAIVIDTDRDAMDDRELVLGHPVDVRPNWVGEIFDKYNTSSGDIENE